jgi:hypothetical protein
MQKHLRNRKRFIRSLPYDTAGNGQGTQGEINIDFIKKSPGEVSLGWQSLLGLGKRSVMQGFELAAGDE